MIILEITKEYNMFHRHIKNIACNLRKQDYREIKSASGDDPKKAVLAGCDISKRLFLVLNCEDNINVPIAVFGVVTQTLNNKTIGVPWMVGTDNIFKARSFLLKNSKRYIDILKEGHEQLINYVDKRNILAIKWLKRCGFSILKAQPYGAENRLFYKFVMECKNV